MIQSKHPKLDGDHSTPLNRELEEVVRETLFEYGSTNKSINLGEAKNTLLKAFDVAFKAFAKEVRDEVIGEYEKLESYPSNSNVNTRRRGCNSLKRNQRKSLNNLIDKWIGGELE